MPKNPYHPYLGPPINRVVPFPKVTDTMLERCRDRNVHVWNLATNKAHGVCIACGTSEAEANQRGEPTWRVPSLTVA